MVEVNTRIFGNIKIEDSQVITFDKGILGFPDLKRFTLIYDVEKGKQATIKWLQSLDEPGFAIPVLDPDEVIDGYCPEFDRDLLKPLGDNLEPENILMFVTITVPKEDATKATVNLKAPIIISMDKNKAVQLICENEQYSIKYGIYDALQSRKKA